MTTKNLLRIAVDGPASSGKSTVAKRVAKDLGLIYLDTGAMYRAVTFLALEHQIDSPQPLIDKLATYPISFGTEGEQQLVYLGDVDVTDAIRQPDVTNQVSRFAAMPEIRSYLVEAQRAIAAKGDIIMDGRDIGTVVLPNAELKIFLVASVDERAERRHKEQVAKGIPSDLETLKQEIESRDYKDSHRAVSPLKQAEDAIYLDTTGLSIDEVVATIEEHAKSLSR